MGSQRIQDDTLQQTCGHACAMRAYRRDAKDDPLYLHLGSVFFFFSSRRRHTRFDCDWSSDVCSSDLALLVSRGGALIVEEIPGTHRLKPHEARALRVACGCVAGMGFGFDGGFWRTAVGIGRGSWRGRGEVSVVAGSFKKKKR